MNWLLDLYQTNPPAQAIALVALVCSLGMTLGSFKLAGVGLGTAGVLFVGLIIGSFSHPVDHATLDFLKEFGLILFVYCIGLQLGPGFVASLRQMGLRLNILATAIVVLGAGTVTGLGWLASLDPAAVLGSFSGATTNTPSLGAAQQAMAALPKAPPDAAALASLAYAATYPLAIVGIIMTILILRTITGIDPRREAAILAAERARESQPLERRTLIVENSKFVGITVGDVRASTAAEVAISRVRSPDGPDVRTAHPATVLHRGDVILVVGSRTDLDKCQAAIGGASTEDLMKCPGTVTFRRVAITNRAVLGKTIGELGLGQLFDVTVTRVTRSSVEMTAGPNLRIQFGDVLQIVGPVEGIDQAAALLGDSLKALNETHFVPLFAGIVVGILLGILPFAVPGLPQPVRLGLAAGPLLVAIFVSRAGHIGPLVWHMPPNVNLAFREFGIALFFASVGLTAGPQFFETVLSPRGMTWAAVGFCVTVGPLLIVGWLALVVLRMNFAVVCGLLAGSMTDPPALAFANGLCDSEAPTVAYAAVYPLTMIMRIVVVQCMAIFLYG
jgi:putative transport protein